MTTRWIKHGPDEQRNAVGKITRMTGGRWWATVGPPGQPSLSVGIHPTATEARAAVEWFDRPGFAAWWPTVAAIAAASITHYPERDLRVVAAVADADLATDTPDGWMFGCPEPRKDHGSCPVCHGTGTGLVNNGGILAPHLEPIPLATDRRDLRTLLWKFATQLADNGHSEASAAVAGVIAAAEPV